MFIFILILYCSFMMSNKCFLLLNVIDLLKGLSNGVICLDHIILHNKNYFMSLTLTETKVNIISGPEELIKGSRRAMFILPIGMELCINEALYSPKSRRNILSFRDIHHNEFHIEIVNEK